MKYDNPLPTAIGVITVAERVLLLRRAIEPACGQWDTVGGFLSGDETAEECLRREAREEIGIDVHALSFLGTFASVYGDTGLQTLGIAFRCEVDGSPIELSDENSEYAWFGFDEVPEVAFADVRKAVAAVIVSSRA
ncbi:NUDIX hydrolase [Nocardia sp. NPDC052566]|uniref:NUDIX hydrolase n=1 Tax=Nocardia sp. NPDC052566 TaxID=3364330 RepID=UPI0037C5E7F8